MKRDLSPEERKRRGDVMRAGYLRREENRLANPGWRLIDLPLFGPTKVPDGVEVYFVSQCGKIGDVHGHSAGSV